MHIAFFLVLILFLFLLLCQDRLSDAVEVDLNRSSSEFHSENPSFESKDNYTEASSLATHPIEQNSDSNLPNSKTSVIRSSSTTKWRFIDPDRFGIVIRGTSRASIMDTIESDISLIQGIIERQLPDYEIEKIPNVLAVMIIFAFRLEMPLNLQMYRRLAYLHCALSKLFDHVGKYTPIHVYLWVQESSMLYLPSWINELFPEVMVVAIPSSSWTLPSDSGNIENWNYGHFHEDYFLMGRWRLTFAMSFVKAMGYQYVLQMDDDTFFMDNIEYNIVHRFQQANIIWGLRNRRFAEVAPITDGFPEITK